jgi:hypothetical protein
MIPIAPGKHIRLSETAIGIGAVILAALRKPKTLDELWRIIQRLRRQRRLIPDKIMFVDVILVVDLLHALGAIRVDETGELRRCD